MPANTFNRMTLIVLIGLLLTGCFPTQQTVEATPESKATIEEPAPASSPTNEPTAVPMAVPTPTVEQPDTQPTGRLIEIRDLYMQTPQEGWAVDRTGRILRTDQGVETWRDVTPAGAWSESANTRAAAAFLGDQAWAVFYIDSSPALSAGADVWHTGNAGATWEKVGAIPPAEEMNAVVQLQFIDDQRGWLLGQIYPGMHHVYAVLYQTVDGGQTWETVSNSSDFNRPEGETLPGSYSLPYGDQVFTFTTPELGFAGVKDLYRTQDGGRTWAIQPLPDLPDAPTLEQPYSFVSPPVFPTSQDGFLVYSLYDYNQVNCPPCDIFIGLPAAQSIYVTHDGGQTWTPQTAPGALGTVEFIDPQNGWFLGKKDEAQIMTSLSHTTDGGSTWTNILDLTELPLGSILDFVTDQVGYATNPFIGIGYQNPGLLGIAGPNPYLFKTEDGGMTWEMVGPVVVEGEP